MGILGFSRALFGKSVSKGNLFSMLGNAVAVQFLNQSRKKWEQARSQSEEALLAEISAYDIGKGAGKLLKGWLLFHAAQNDTPVNPKLTLKQAEDKLQVLLKSMDAVDLLPEEQARSRFLVSKALFCLEGFKLSQCRYEAYQKASWELLRKNPAHRTLNRNELFRGTVFLPEDLIATTHRMLLMLDNGQLPKYMESILATGSLKDDADYMARLIAVTFHVSDAALGSAINQWFQQYCDFKIDQTHQQEAWMNTSISTVTGGLPATIGWDLLGRARKRLFRKKSSSKS